MYKNDVLTGQRFSIGSDFVSQETFSNVWKHFGRFHQASEVAGSLWPRQEVFWGTYRVKSSYLFSPGEARSWEHWWRAQQFLILNLQACKVSRSPAPPLARVLPPPGRFQASSGHLHCLVSSLIIFKGFFFCILSNFFTYLQWTVQSRFSSLPLPEAVNS